MASTKRSPSPEELFLSPDLLVDLHATSCGLKASASTAADECLEVCRRAPGGHGYSAFRGIGSWYADFLPKCTWEGDSFMLSQQLSRYLLKCARSVRSGASPTNDATGIFTDFLRRQDIDAAFDMLSADADIVDAFAW